MIEDDNNILRLIDLLTLAKHKMNLPKQSEQPVKKKSYRSDAKREGTSPSTSLPRITSHPKPSNESLREGKEDYH